MDKSFYSIHSLSARKMNYAKLKITTFASSLKQYQILSKKTKLFIKYLKY